MTPYRDDRRKLVCSLCGEEQSACRECGRRLQQGERMWTTNCVTVNWQATDDAGRYFVNKLAPHYCDDCGNKLRATGEISP